MTTSQFEPPANRDQTGGEPDSAERLSENRFRSVKTTFQSARLENTGLIQNWFRSVILEEWARTAKKSTH
jgi:hypothetical protein